MRAHEAARAPATRASGESPVLQLRVLVETDDYDAAIRFYRDELGLPEQAAFAGAGEARVAILDAGRATLELANPAQRRLIDEAEVGPPSGPRIRVALEVADTIEVTERLVAAGAALLSSPRETPWRSLNARLDAPAGLQLTLFEELEPLAERAGRPGFGTDASRAGAMMQSILTTRAAPWGPVATDQIDLPRSHRFDPAAVVVSVGAAVRWTNRDQFTHSVRLPDRTHFILRPGESATYTFRQPGEYPYYCSFHAQDMHGTVIVEARE